MARLLVIAALVLAACSPKSSTTAGDPAAPTASVKASAATAEDSAAIRSTLDRWYAAMQSVDSAGTLAPLTPQFLLLEDTLPLSGEALLARLRKGGTETKWAAEFSDMRTRTLGNVAWTTLRNHETSQGKDGKQCVADFLETIVFVREGERWLMDRYHAAEVHPWKCAA